MWNSNFGTRGSQLLSLALNKRVLLHDKNEKQKLPSFSTFLSRHNHDTKNPFNASISPILPQKKSKIDDVVPSYRASSNTCLQS